MLDLLAVQTVQPDDVEAIRVSTSRRNATILRNSRPQTGLEAKFSMQFAMASAIVARRVGLAELTDSFVQRRDVQALMMKVTVEPDDREDPKHPGAAPYDLVVIDTLDGRRLESAHITDERGSPGQPLSTEELWTKSQAVFRSAIPSCKPGWCSMHFCRSSVSQAWRRFAAQARWRALEHRLRGFCCKKSISGVPAGCAVRAALQRSSRSRFETHSVSYCRRQILAKLQKFAVYSLC
jgi:hypothetical protein